MKKLLTAAVAAAAGAFLLLGGGGTLASWQDVETTQARQITAGTLSLGPIGADRVSWSLGQEVPGSAPAPAVPYRGQSIVPGDVLTATVDIPVRLDGQNLAADLTLARAAVTPANPGRAADVALAQAMTVRVLSLGGTPIAPGQAPSLALRAGQAPATVRAVVAVSLPWGAAGQNAGAVGGSLSVSMDYSLTQKPAAS